MKQKTPFFGGAENKKEKKRFLSEKKEDATGLKKELTRNLSYDIINFRKSERLYNCKSDRLHFSFIFVFVESRSCGDSIDPRFYVGRRAFFEYERLVGAEKTKIHLGAV